MTDIILKHGTCACRASIIEREGFLSDSYFTDSDDIARYYAIAAMEECDCEDYAIVSAKLMASSLKTDLNSYAEPLTYFRNEYTSCEKEWFRMIDEGDVPYPSSPSDYLTSLRVVRSVRCTVAVSGGSAFIKE